MAKKGRVHASLDELRAFTQALKVRPVIQVGVFAGKASRTDGLSNADLAAIHEFGDPRHELPARSMLITPLHDHAKQIIDSMRGHVHELAEQGKIKQAWKQIGIACEKVISQAFDTGGFGKWEKLKDATIWKKLKGSMSKRVNQFWNIKAGNGKSAILIDTAQLRRAFSSRVVMKS